MHVVCMLPLGRTGPQRRRRTRASPCSRWRRSREFDLRRFPPAGAFRCAFQPQHICFCPPGIPLKGPEYVKRSRVLFVTGCILPSCTSSWATGPSPSILSRYEVFPCCHPLNQEGHCRRTRRRWPIWTGDGRWALLMIEGGRTLES